MAEAQTVAVLFTDLVSSTERAAADRPSVPDRAVPRELRGSRNRGDPGSRATAGRPETGGSPGPPGQKRPLAISGGTGSYPAGSIE